MRTRRRLLTRAGVLLLALGLGWVPAHAAGPALSDVDRAGIEDLVARYARALGSCAPDEWADLYAAPDGSFSSDSRGHVAGHARLAALVRSEPGCTRPAQAGGGARRAPAPATIALEATDGGAAGVVKLGGGAYYQDTYVKTQAGWRFRSRTVVSAQDVAAHLTVDDFLAIRRLAGEPLGMFDDLYVDAFTAPHSSATPGARAGRFFRASGLVLTLASDGSVHGKAYLRGDGGYYDDVYVKAGASWRFQSRTYVSGTQAEGAAHDGR